MMNEQARRPALLKRFALSPVPWLVLTLALQTAVNLRTPRFEGKLAEEASAEYLKQLPARMLRILSFGNLPVLVDWLWVKCLVDPSTQPVKAGTRTALYHRADLLTELDPAFYDVYLGAGHLLGIARNDTRGAIALSTKGQRFVDEVLPTYPQAFRDRFWKNSYWPHVFSGYLYLFELDDLPNAAIAFQKAAEQPGAPEYLLQMKARLQKPAGRYEVGLRLLNFMIRQATEPKVKARLEEKRRSLFLAQYIFEVERAFREYLSGIPEYRANPNISHPRLSAHWSKFLRQSRMSSQDPLGGRIFLSREGRVTSTTPYETVFGIR